LCTGKGGYLKERAVRFWDRMQKEVACCGINGYTDWATRQLEIQVPESCCKVQYSMPGVPDPNSSFLLVLSCGSRMFIPDSNFFHPRSRVRTFSIPDPGSEFFPFRIRSKEVSILT
jgi:hypothetical protein